MSQFQVIMNSKLTDLNPVVAGRCSVDPDHIQRIEKISYTLIHHVRKGGGTYYIADQAFPIKQGDCYVTLPGVCARFVSDNMAPLELEWVGFTGHLSHDFTELPPVFSVSEPPFPHNKDLDIPPPMLAVGLASDLFHLYYTFLGTKNKRLDYVEYISEYIRSHYMEKISVEEFARQFGIDRRHMSAQFKKKTGFSIQEYLTKTRIDESMSYLAQGYSGKEVAKMCGYSDAHNFYKAFKKYQGQRPSAWKERQIMLTEENSPLKKEG